MSVAADFMGSVFHHPQPYDSLVRAGDLANGCGRREQGYAYRDNAIDLPDSNAVLLQQEFRKLDILAGFHASAYLLYIQ